MELQQRSVGILILARLMKLEDNWFLNRGGIEKDHVDLRWELDRPRGNGKFGQFDPPFATLDRRNYPRR